MTVQELVNLSLTLCGRLGAGRTPGAAESGVSLGILQGLLDSWATQRRAVFSVTKAQYTLTPGTENYTIGPSGTFNTTRPAMIEAAFIVATVEGQSMHSPLEILNLDQWAQITRLGDKSALPRKLYSDHGSPLTTLSLYPIPATATGLELHVWQTIANFTALSDTVTLPQGYLRALSYSFAVELAPAFNLPVPPAVAAIAQSSRESIDAINARLLPDLDMEAGSPAPKK